MPFNADSPLTITVKHIDDPLPVEHLRLANVPPPIEQVVVKMTAKSAQDRYQSTDALIDALTGALAASNLVMPHRWRPGMSAPMPKVDPQVGLPVPPPPHIPSQPLPPNPNMSGGQQLITVQCFRCGASNPSTRLFCTACGYELADKRAVNDRFLGPNGRPVLARLSIQNGPMGGRSYLFHQDVTTVGRNNGNDLIIPGTHSVAATCSPVVCRGLLVLRGFAEWEWHIGQQCAHLSSRRLEQWRCDQLLAMKLSCLIPRIDGVCANCEKPESESHEGKRRENG